MKKKIQLIIGIMLIFLQAKTFAETQVIEGKITKDESKTENNSTKIIKSNISKEIHKNLDVQVLGVKFYYHPDADVFYDLYIEEGQRQYPHLLDYKEMDGIYNKALSESETESELTKWAYQGGPRPYYINAGTEIRNNGTAAFTDVNLTFEFEVKVAELKASPTSLTTNYTYLEQNARWQKWLTKTINIKILPPGEYTIIHTEDLSLCNLFAKLNTKWPFYIRVKVNAYSPMDSIKTNNYATKNLQLIPNHFITHTLH
ncbi:MAG: hypothetical protein AB7V50_05410 [Vampirovibrionia bacterium]